MGKKSGSGMGKSQDSGPGMNNPDPQHWFKIRARNNFFGSNTVLKFFDADPGSEIRDLHPAIKILKRSRRQWFKFFNAGTDSALKNNFLNQTILYFLANYEELSGTGP